MISTARPSPARDFRGRALLIAADGSLYVGRGQRIYRSHDLGATWRLDAQVPSAVWKTAFTWSRLARRALRHEIRGLAVLSDGTRIAIARNGIFRAAAGETHMAPVFRFVRGSHPLNLCVNASDEILFGEYGRNPKRHGMFIYASHDRGRTFDVAHEFSAGSIRHIHNVIHDAFLDAYWVLVGDYDQEPGIALLSRDFAHLDWIARGEQHARAVSALVEADCLIYGTDSELEPNYIVRLDKKTGRRELLAPTSGSSPFAARYGAYRAVSTAVEPSPVNLDRTARLLISTDGHDWREIASHEKDEWHPYLQYGCIVLAPSSHKEPIVMYSGQALKNLDDTCRTLVLR